MMASVSSGWTTCTTAQGPSSTSGDGTGLGVGDGVCVEVGAGEGDAVAVAVAVGLTVAVCVGDGEGDGVDVRVGRALVRVGDGRSVLVPVKVAVFRTMPRADVGVDELGVPVAGRKTKKRPTSSATAATATTARIQPGRRRLFGRLRLRGGVTTNSGRLPPSKAASYRGQVAQLPPKQVRA
jgi:hypothetical protein